MDYSDAYLTQLTEGCGVPNCRTLECFSCQNFKYKNISDEEITEICTKYAQTPDHLCPNLSPFIVNTEIFELIILFEEFSNMIISEDKNADFSIFENLLKSREAFCMIFKSEYDVAYNNFSFDQEMLMQFLQAIENNSNLLNKFRRYKKQFIDLIKLFRAHPHPYVPHFFRGLALIMAFLPIFFPKVEFKNILDLYSGLLDYTFGLSEQNYSNFCYNTFKYLELTERIVKTNISFINTLETRTMLFFLEKSKNLLIIVEKFALINTDSGSPLNYKIFQSPQFSENIMSNPFFLNIICQIGNNTLLSIFHSIFTLPLKRLLREKNISNSLDFPLLIGSSNSKTLDIKVHRDTIWQDIVPELNSKPPESFQYPLNVSFYEEKGEDKGGVSREMFHILSNQIFSEEFGLFQLIDNKFYWFKSFSNKDIKSIEIVGKLLGLAFHNGIMLPIRFPLCLYKKLLKYPTTMKDLSEIKPEVASSLISLRNDDINFAELDLRFEVTSNRGSKHEIIPLKENGSDIVVSKDNVDEYIQLMINWELHKSIEIEYNAFSKGFYIPAKLDSLAAFEPEELDILMSGQTVYNWNEFKSSTIYTCGYKSESQTIRMFWKIFDELTEKEKIKFLKFLTGSSLVPVTGLKEVQLEIQKSTDTEKLPVAHTCTNILQLPDYCDEDKLRKNIKICIEYNEGFGVI